MAARPACQGRRPEQNGRNGADHCRPAAPASDRQAPARPRGESRQDRRGGGLFRAGLCRARQPRAPDAADDRGEKAEAPREPLTALVRVTERRVDLRGQAARGAAREMKKLGLAPGRREWSKCSVANDRRVITVGDNEPGFGGQITLLLKQPSEVRWHSPKEAVAIF